MGRIVGLLVLGLALAMFGFNNSALSWLGIVGLMVLRDEFRGRDQRPVHPVEQQVGDGLMSSYPARVGLDRRRPLRVRGPVTRRPGVGGRGGNTAGRIRTDSWLLPNWQFAVWLLVSAVMWLGHPRGWVRAVLVILASAALALWAGAEVLRGVNPFRRLRPSQCPNSVRA